MRVRSLALLIPVTLLTCGPAHSWTAASSQAAPLAAESSSAGAPACPAAHDIDALLATASSLLEQGRFSEAVTALQAKSPPGCDPRVSLLLAAAFEGSGDTPAAVRVLEQAIAVWPANSSIATSLARYYLRAGDTAKAEQAIEQCKPDDSTPLRELQMMAMVYLENQNLPRAKTVAVLAYRRYPSEETLLFTANVLQLQGRDQDVLALLQKERPAYSNSAPFLITIAESEYDGSMYAPAREDLKRAVVLNARSYPAHYLLANVLVQTGDIDGGIREYHTAIELAPQQPRTYYRLGLALEKKVDNAGARNQFQRSLAVDGHYAPAYCELGKLELRANHLQDAADDLSRAIEYNPSLQESYFLLVQVYARMGERDKSRAVMDQWNAFKNSHRLRVAGPAQGDPLSDAPPNAGPGSASTPR